MSHFSTAFGYVARGGGWLALKRAQYHYARATGCRPLHAAWITFGWEAQ